MHRANSNTHRILSHHYNDGHELNHWRSLLFTLASVLTLCGCQALDHKVIVQTDKAPNGDVQVTRYYVASDGRKVLHGKCMGVTHNGSDRTVKIYRDGVLVSTTYRSVREREESFPNAH